MNYIRIHALNGPSKGEFINRRIKTVKKEGEVGGTKQILVNNRYYK